MAQTSSNGHSDELVIDIVTFVTWAHSSCNRDLLEAIGREQLSFSQLTLLDRLRGGRLRPTLRQAAAMMHRTPQAASQIVSDLARRGLVHREADDHDYRAKRLVITERGEQVIHRLHAPREDGIAAAIETLSAEEREQLAEILEQLRRREDIAACRPVAAVA